jgi:hypothetical protein
LTKAAASIFYFGIYVLVLGLALIAAPNLVLAPFGFPPTSEVWLRVVGVLAAAIGWYYVSSARAGLEPFFRATFAMRVLVFVCFGAFVVLGFAKPALALFGAVDLAGALWTATALRKS